MVTKLKVNVNGLTQRVTASLDTPLLYVLHNELHLHGPRFGCGLAQCGACEGSSRAAKPQFWGSQCEYCPQNLSPTPHLATSTRRAVQKRVCSSQILAS
jgi:hypothetical protein